MSDVMMGVSTRGRVHLFFCVVIFSESLII